MGNQVGGLDEKTDGLQREIHKVVRGLDSGKRRAGSGERGAEAESREQRAERGAGQPGNDSQRGPLGSSDGHSVGRPNGGFKDMVGAMKKEKAGPSQAFSLAWARLPFG